MASSTSTWVVSTVRGGGGEAQLDVGLDVIAGESDAALGVLLGANREVAVSMYAFDGPGVAVLDEGDSVATGELALVAASDDGVPDPGRRAIAELDACLGDEAGVDARGACPDVQRCDVVARLGDEEAAQSGSGVALPCVVGGLPHRICRAGVDAVVGEVASVEVRGAFSGRSG